MQLRILKKGEVKPPDYNQFVQCYECGNVLPIYEAHFESQIKDSLQTIDNPFEESASIFLSVGKRKLKGRWNKYQDKDPEIAEEIRKHGEDNVKIIYDSCP